MAEIIKICLINACILSVVFAFIGLKNYKTVKQSREKFMKLHEELKPGKRVQFAGGFVGRVVGVKEDYCDVELTKDVVVTVSRYSISEIIEK